MVWESQWALALVAILIIFICEVFSLRDHIPKLINYAINILMMFFSVFMLLYSACLSYIDNSQHKVTSSDQNEHAGYFMLLTVSLNGAIWFLLVIFYTARVFMPSSNLMRCQTWLLILVLLVVVFNAASVNAFGVLAVDVNTVVVIKGNDSSPQTLSSITAATIVDNSTSKTSPTTSTSPSVPVTTAKSSTTAATIVDNSTTKAPPTTSITSSPSVPVTTAKSSTTAATIVDNSTTKAPPTTSITSSPSVPVTTAKSSTTAATIVDNSTTKAPPTTSITSSPSVPVTTAKSLTPLEKMRSDFCQSFSEYDALCKGDNPAKFYVETKPLAGNNISDVPVVVVATKKKTRLHRSLYHLLLADGANKSMITVVLDGEYPCQAAVAKLFGVKSEFNNLTSTGIYRVTEHYKMTITKMFDLYPDAPYIILLEDDLQVSPDFYNFFSQTEYLMREDDSLFCISAWNDFGYKHSSKDTSAVFRIEGMPGLGWMLSRKLYKSELEAKWPNKSEPLTWDEWLRAGPQLQGRECLVPEVSRTYHFDTGLHINAKIQRDHFNTRNLAQDHLIPLHNLNRQAISIKRNTSKCDNGLVPHDKGKVFILFLNDNKKQYQTLAKCFNLWRYDIRAGHQNLWRMTIRDNQYLFMRCPISPYCSYMPNELMPMKFTNTNFKILKGLKFN